MKVTKNITIDLNNPRRHMVHLMQSGNQREITLTLLKDGMPFDVSEDIGTATLVKGVGYIKANGVPGYYDWTSTDEAAVALVTNTTNKWTVRLDEHATDVPGFSQIFVKFSLASGETLYAFPITLDVIQTSGGSTDPDKPYYHSTSFLLAGAQAEKTASMTSPVGVDPNGKLWADTLMTMDAKDALLNLLAHVAYIDQNGQDYYDALELALRAKLSYIVADYAQDHTVYDTDSLDVIKEGDDLIVTAYYDDGTHVDLADSAYTLSGTLTAGTSTITVTYGGKTTTFDVTVTTAYLYRAVDQTITTSTAINTEVNLITTDIDFTICADATLTTRIGGWKLFHQYENGSPWRGITFGKGSNSDAIEARYINTYGTVASSGGASVTSAKVVMVHKNGTGYATVYFRLNGASTTSKITISNSFVSLVAQSSGLVFGYHNASNNWAGTLNKGYILSLPLTEDRVEAFMGGDF